MDANVVEELVRRLLDGKKSKAPGKKVQLSEAEIRHLCVTAKDIFLSQPNLLELEAPISVCVSFLIDFVLLLAARGWWSDRFHWGIRFTSLFQATSTGSSPICSGCSSTADCRRAQTTCSSATTWTGESRRLRCPRLRRGRCRCRWVPRAAVVVDRNVDDTSEILTWHQWVKVAKLLGELHVGASLQDVLPSEKFLTFPP